MQLGVDAAPVHRLDQHVVDLDDLRSNHRVLGLQPGEIDDLADQIRQPGRGSTFTLRLPTHQPTPSDEVPGEDDASQTPDSDGVVSLLTRSQTRS
ncbi:MAG TPA: hypothetical protein VFU98_04175 [Microlunatus sp.]|nr:hypothetical protein [Microlunatus sp.]